MSNKEILEIATQKAIDRGWCNGALKYTFVGNGVHFQMSEVSFEMRSYNDIIFNHDFAKALWGETKVNDMVDKYELLKKKGLVYAYDNANESFEYDEPVWMWHLQQMVIAEDPIKYLGDNS